jgi:hypothetical protein
LFRKTARERRKQQGILNERRINSYDETTCAAREGRGEPNLNLSFNEFSKVIDLSLLKLINMSTLGAFLDGGFITIFYNDHRCISLVWRLI